MESDFQKNISSVGIAFSENRINAVKIKKEGGRYTLLKAWEDLFENSNFNDPAPWRDVFLSEFGEIINSEEAVVRVCVPLRQSLSKVIATDVSLVENIPEWLDWAARQYLPSSSGNFEYGFSSLKRNGGESLRVLSTAFPQEAVDVMNIGEAGKRHSGKPIVDSLAMYYASDEQNILNDKPAVILLNIDGLYLTYTIIENSEYIDSGTLKARNVLSDYHTIDGLVTDVKTALTFKLDGEHRPDTSIALLCGDIPEERLFIKRLGYEIASRTEIAKPFDIFRISPEIDDFPALRDRQHCYFTAVGAALSNINEKQIDINPRKEPAAG
ncbi:MAG: hypothetical protein GF307_10345 [candidate division Zixibacteria bacterium]|nr:hypothetical protein [candidate division Zixibacteria bacterium]